MLKNMTKLMNINSDHNLPLNKTDALSGDTHPILNDENNFYPRVFFEKCLYKLAK